MEIPYIVKPRRDTGLYNAKVGIWLFLASEVMLFGALVSSYILLRVGATEWPHGLLNVPIGTFNTVVLITSSITVVMAWVSCKMNQFSKFKLYQACTVLLALTFIVIKSFEYHDKFTHYEIHLHDQVILSDGKVIWGNVRERSQGTVTVEPTTGRPGEYEKAMKIETSQVARIVDGKFADGHLVEQTKDHVTLHGHTVDKREELLDLSRPEAKRVQHEEIRIEVPQIAKMENYGPWHSTYLAIYFTLTALHALHVLGGALVIGWIWGPGAKMWKTDPERFTNRVEVSGLFWHFVDLVWIFLFPVLYLL